MKKLLGGSVAVGLLWSLAAMAGADTVTLQDGRVVKGKVVSTAGAAVVEIEAAGGTLRYPASLVKSIAKDEAAPSPPATALPAPAGTGNVVAPRVAEPPPVGGSGTGPDIDAPRFAKTKVEADQALTAADGLAVWQKLLADSSRGPAIESARKELGIWQQRASQDLVRFGPDWQPRAAVAERQAKADEWVAKADAEVNVDEAAKMYDQAAQTHPYRVDIPFRKAMRYYRAARERQFGTSMGEVLKIEPNHAPARNNLGVLAAQQKNWTSCFAYLGKAAASLVASDPSNVTVLDNLDLAIAQAERDGQPPAVLAATQAQIPVVVRTMQQAGRAVGQMRWGNTWVSQADYDERVRRKQELERQLADAKSRLAKVDARLKENQRVLDEGYRKQREIYAKRYYSRTLQEIAFTQDWYARAAALENEMTELRRLAWNLPGEVRSLETRRTREAAPHAAGFMLLDERGGTLERVDDGPAFGEPAP